MDQTIKLKHLAARYDAAAKGWRDKIKSMGYPAAYESLISQCFPTPVAGMEVLDAGSGAGDFSKAYLDVGHQPKALTLLDISSEMLRVAQQELRSRRVPIICAKGEIEALTKDTCFDLILCAHVIEHCENPLATIKILHGALKPGGGAAFGCQ